MTASTLTKKQEQALLALLNQATIAQAAVTAGISESTLYRWLNDPTFAAEYRRARREAVRQATARLQQVAWAAVATLVQLMTTTTVPPATRRAAARDILDLGYRAIELEDLEQRVAELEAKYEAAELERAGIAPVNGIE